MAAPFKIYILILVHFLVRLWLPSASASYVEMASRGMLTAKYDMKALRACGVDGFEKRLAAFRDTLGASLPTPAPPVGRSWRTSITR